MIAHGTAALTLPFILTASLAAAQGNVDLPRFPSISPDGSHIVFSWRGDLWKVASDGGPALRLTVHPANELRSAWSPDGTRIAFASNRTGSLNLFTMNADGTGVRQVTDDDSSAILAGFARDDHGEWLTYETNAEGDVYREPRPYMVPADGGTPQRIHGAFGRHPMISPDGARILFTRGGSSWTRRHYRGPDNRNVWLFDRRVGQFHQLTDWPGNDGKAKWETTSTFLFLSDREDETVNLYRMRLGFLSPPKVERLTTFIGRDVWDFDVASGGATAVLAAWDTLYVVDLTEARAQPRALAITASEDEADNFELIDASRRVDEAALSPDGKTMAAVAYGEVFVRAVEEGSPTRRVTDSHARDRDIAWSPDGLKLYFVSDRNGSDSIFAATVAITRGDVKSDFDKAVGAAANEEKADKDTEEAGQETDDAGRQEPEAERAKKKEDVPLPPELDAARWQDAWTFSIEPVVVTEHNDRDPVPSPDGRSISFRRGRGDLVIRDLTTGVERTLVEGWDSGLEWRWSPDSSRIAYSVNDRNFNADVWISEADGSTEPVNISQHPDTDSSPRWNGDSGILTFISERVNEEYDVWSVYLDREIADLEGRDLEQYYKNAAEAAKKRKPLPTRPETEVEQAERDEEPDTAAPRPELELGDAYLRLRRLTRDEGNEVGIEVTPAGDRYIFNASGGEGGLQSIDWRGGDRKRLGGDAHVQHLTLEGDKVVVVSGGRAATVGVSGGSMVYCDIDWTMRIDLEQQASQKFHEMARIIGEVFYHPTMKDLDWAALTQMYHDLAMQTRTADEFEYVAEYLLGELNGSHLGVSAPSRTDAQREPAGEIGIDYEVVEDGFRVTSIIPDAPSDKGPMELLVGDIITGINFEAVRVTEPLAAHLRGRIGMETAFDARRMIEGDVREVRLIITPQSSFVMRGLVYEAWQRENQRKVHEWSDGRIGYLHIRGMNQSSLDEFERDLYAAANGKDGLLIDVRNNGGGSTADLVLASIMVEPHAYTVPRGADPAFTDGYPQDRLYIQRYTGPINMLCNEKSFSNAEIVSHAFKTLKRGKLVGQQTYGGVISTGGTRLIDGTSVRTPFRGWYLLDGTDMENNGAVPDILVPQTPEDESAGFDRQLKAAVDDLVLQIDAR